MPADQEPAIAVVTGAAGEIGAELTAALTGDGYLVHAVDIDDRVGSVAERHGAISHVADVTDESSLTALAELDGIDVLVNAVGAWPRLSFDELSPSVWRKALEVNLTSAYVPTWVCRAGLRTRHGSVVNLSSAIAFKGHPQLIQYAAAKAGLIGLTRALALSLGPDGVRVNAVAPGLVATERNQQVWSPERRAAFRAGRALDDEIEIGDVVAAVRYLAGAANKAVTGQTLVVDGGTVMH